jgi:drug/metabolite transporter (DMT)-like permease
MWGVYWYPLRVFSAAGISGAWPLLLMFSSIALVMVPIGAWRLRAMLSAGWGMYLTGLCSAGSWVIYSYSLLMTDVVRALLLFYMTPVWGALLARLLLKEPITPVRMLAIAMGLGGLAVILGFEGGVPLPHNAGDWLGLLSGVLWGYTMVRLRREEGRDLFTSLFAYFACGTLVAVVVVLLPFEFVGEVPARAVVAEQAWGLALMGLCFILPTILLITWGSRMVSPGRAGVLLMAEAVVGTVSAAVLTDEPFGLREIVGALLIISAGIVDVLWAPAPKPAPAGD